MTQNKMKKNRQRAGSFLALVGGGVNLILAGLKMLAGFFSGSAATMADGINNLSDSLCFGVAFFGFHLASKPADRKHPYGHARMEYLSGLAISALIVFMGFELCIDSIQKLLNPAKVETSLLFWGALTFSVLAKLTLAVLFHLFGKRLSSDTLRLSAMDSRNDVIATCGVMLAAVLGQKLDLPLDGAVGLGISVFIVVGGILQIQKAVSPLLGEADEKTRQKILNCIEIQKPLLGWHDLLVHDYGPGKCYASLHLEVSSEADALICHKIVDEIERKCLEETGVELIIHCDPAPKKSSEQEYFMECLEETLRATDYRLKLHDLYLEEKEKKKTLCFHILIPQELEGQHDSIQKTLEKKMEEEGISSLAITFDPQ